MSLDPKKNSPQNRPGNPAVAAGGKSKVESAAALGFEPEAPETSGDSNFPAWLIVGLAVLFYWGQMYLEKNAGEFNSSVYGKYANLAQLEKDRPQDPEADRIRLGKQKYEAVCMACHQANGLGTPGQFPPLSGSEWVNGPVKRLIRIPEKGLAGPITVKGIPFDANMLALGSLFSDEELAALLSYVRQAWDNKSGKISAEEVKAVREEIKDRTAQWSAEELLKVQ